MVTGGSEITGTLPGSSQRSETRRSGHRNRYRDRHDLTLGHEKRDVYRLSLGYVAWGYVKAETFIGVHRPARDQWWRASQSIRLNIAEGNGKTADADRRRYFGIARGSALECAAIEDVPVVGKALDRAESHSRTMELERMAAMLRRREGDRDEPEEVFVPMIVRPRDYSRLGWATNRASLAAGA